MSSLDPSKLTSVDEHGDRVGIIPAEVRGFFRRHRTWTQLVLLVVFLALPWTKVGGHQTILLNIPQREFALFGVLFKAHDAPLLFFIFGTLALGLAFVTSIWGRVWCGWACPQTVFIDAVFRRIEQWTEGSYIKRRALRDGPMTFEKVRKTGLKWILFVIVSSLIAHSFMAYFVGAADLIEMIQNDPSKNLTYFLLVTFFTAATLFDFGWFREQFCVIMCPYGRIQSVLLDQKSMAVVYDVQRGEPRKGQAPPGKTAGDCVSCNRCVQVCPTGIDIRNGLQMECIACTACIDACDEIMEKVKKPKGLIRYDTLDGSPISLMKPRSIIYIVAIVSLILGLGYAVATRESAHFTILRGAGLPYSYVKNSRGEEVILNQFRVHIQNQGKETARYELSLPAEFLKQDVEFSVAENPLTLASGESREWYFFVRIVPSLFDASGKIKTQLQIRDLNNEKFQSQRELILVGPKQ
ncbi:cytochrome c oxidase accessory protein CcoG [Bdellovibrio sp. HCB-162]|uniref:cytochrome c oxidase accessory protein CcoG n=1 Tax=Bdellovibrio sp. HCB-162 TaxID=3394234 RepID=UPI0039BC8DCA